MRTGVNLFGSGVSDDGDGRSGRRCALCGPPRSCAASVLRLLNCLVSNYIGPYLTDILASLQRLSGWWRCCLCGNLEGATQPAAVAEHEVAAGALLRAWSPYILLVIFVLLWGYGPFKALLDKATIVFAWPRLDGQIQRLPPVVALVFATRRSSRSNILLSVGIGGACSPMLFSAVVLRVPVGKVVAIIGGTSRDLALAILTIASVLALAYVMNYWGNTATLGLAFAATGAMFPFFARFARVAAACS